MLTMLTGSVVPELELGLSSLYWHDDEEKRMKRSSTEEAKERKGIFIIILRSVQSLEVSKHVTDLWWWSVMGFVSNTDAIQRKWLTMNTQCSSFTRLRQSLYCYLLLFILATWILEEKSSTFNPCPFDLRWAFLTPLLWFGGNYSPPCFTSFIHLNSSHP